MSYCTYKCYNKHFLAYAKICKYSCCIRCNLVTHKHHRVFHNYSKRNTEHYRNTGEVGQIARPADNLVEAVIGEVEQRDEEVVVALLELAAAALLLRLVLAHHRLDRLHVLQYARRVRLQWHRLHL